MSAQAVPRHPITRDDLERQMRAIQGEVDETRESAQSSLLAVGAVAVVAAIAIAFLAGRRKGRKRTTIVEVRRI